MAGKATRSNRTTRPNWIETYDSQGYGNSEVVSTAPCTLLRVRAHNKGAATLFVFLYDSKTVPGSGAPMVQPMALAPGAQQDFALNEIAGDGLLGLDTTQGLAWVASTAADTLSADTTSSIALTARFTT